MTATNETVLHTYGVVADSEVPLPKHGIGGTPLGILDVNGLAVVVGAVDAARLGPRVWEQHGEDPQWLGRVAQAHHEVLQAICTGNPPADVLPLRLPGIYPDEDALRAALLPAAEALSEALGRIRGRLEWGVQVFRVGEPAATEAEPASSGRDYLKRKAAATAAREEGRTRRQREIAEAYDVLAGAADNCTTNPPQDPALSGRPDPMVLNAAFLVARSEEARFFSAAEQVGQQLGSTGLRVEVSGPWPPYNFTRIGEREMA